MNNEIMVLAGTAAGLGFIHTLLGPDHYIPFIAMSKARGWSALRTAVVTFLCGLGHVLSSVAIGLAGIALGTAVFRLESIESFRGEVAGWFLLAFGFVYTVWGTWRALKGRAHEHGHFHEDGEFHSHTHSHLDGHAHVHERDGRRSITPWVLFTIFVFGPCEPLIPIIMYPAAKFDWWSVVFVSSVFSAATIATMLSCVLAAHYGLSRLSFPRIERFSHALAGFAVLACGVAVTFLGL